jgi:predicted Zn-dependent protease
MDNKWKVIIVCSVFLMNVVFNSYAETPLTIEDRAKLGEVYSLEKLKKFSQAEPMIEVLYQRYPDNNEIRWTYVRVLGFGGHWKEATEAFKTLCASKCDEDMFVTYAHILESQGPNPETLIFIKNLADQHQAQAKIQSIYAEILSWNIQKPQGQQMIEELSAKYPNDLKIEEALGDIAFLSKDYALAQKDYESILEKSDTARIGKKYADTLVAQKKYDDAISEMDKLLSSNPNDKELKYQHAQVVSASGDHQRAVNELKVLLNGGFANKEAAIMLGDELRLLGRDEESLKVYQGVVNEK